MISTEIEKSALRALFWKDEILQVLYWMEGEGFGSWVSITQLQAFLTTNSDNLLYHLKRLSLEDYLEMEGESNEETIKISLSSIGKKEAGRYFSEAFEGLQKGGHGECGPDCEFCYGSDGVKLENCVHDCGHQN